MADVELKPQVYKDPRPKEYFDEFHHRVRHGKPEWVYEIVRIVTGLHALITFRARALGTEHVPNGPVIIAPNHGSFMDHFFSGVFLRRRVQFMAKSQLFSGGPAQWIYTHGGVFPVRRGAADEEAFVTAEKVLERAGAVVMYCEGGRSRTGQLADTAKPGIGRLALQSGAPVVPVAILGSHKVRNWKKLRFPKVTIQYGEPFRFQTVAAPTREQQQKAADEIFRRIRALHDHLARVGHAAALRGSAERSVPQSDASAVGR